MRKLLWILLAGSAFAQGIPYHDIALDRFGTPIPKASVLVCGPTATGTPCTPLASVFSNVALSVPITQPFLGDAFGNFNFYAAPGIYEVQVTGQGVTTSYFVGLGSGGIGGTVTSFSAGTLSPLFTTSVANPTTTPALSFALTDAAANTVFGNFSGGTGAPSYNAVAPCGDSTHALGWVAGTGFGCQAITAGGSGTGVSELFGPTCTTGMPPYSSCTTQYFWSVPFADATYKPVCSPVGEVNNVGSFSISTWDATSITVMVDSLNGAGAAISYANVVCSVGGGSGTPGGPQFSVQVNDPAGIFGGFADYFWQDDAQRFGVGSGNLPTTGAGSNWFDFLIGINNDVSLSNGLNYILGSGFLGDNGSSTVNVGNDNRNHGATNEVASFGFRHVISGSASTATVNGASNFLNAADAYIGGGESNSIGGNDSTICGGEGNISFGRDFTLCGGERNYVDASSSDGGTFASEQIGMFCGDCYAGGEDFTDSVGGSVMLGLTPFAGGLLKFTPPTISNGGTGYCPGDVLTVNDGNFDGVIQITTTDGSYIPNPSCGVATALRVINSGDGYSINMGVATGYVGCAGAPGPNIPLDNFGDCIAAGDGTLTVDIPAVDTTASNQGPELQLTQTVVRLGAGADALVIDRGVHKGSLTLNGQTGQLYGTSGRYASSADETATISDITLITVPAAGQYRFSVYVMSNATCMTPGPGQVMVGAKWTDVTGVQKSVTVPLDVDAATSLTTNLPLGTVTGSASGSLNLFANPSTAIVFNTVFTDCTSAGGAYRVYVTAEQIQ